MKWTRKLTALINLLLIKRVQILEQIKYHYLKTLFYYQTSY
jgi:hypothetical protein